MRQLLLASSFSLIACAGKAPSEIPPEVDAPAADGPIAPVGQRVSGKAMDYFTAVPMTDATIATDGIDPPMTALSITDGSWALEGVPTGSKVFLTATHALYRPTRNVATTVADVPVVQDAYAMTIQDVARQSATLGKQPAAGTAFLEAEMQMANGMPVVGIPLANVVLVDTLGAPVPGVLGPFFIGTVGDIDPALTTATAFLGRSRVAFLDVPPGTFSLKVTYPGGAGDITDISSVTSAADGAVLALTGGLGSGGPGSAITDPMFSVDIYPRLQRAAVGGLGCANCHTLGGPGAIIQFDLPAAMVLASLLPAAPNGRIDTVTPANSMFLTKPLYEPAPLIQNHPNATFIDINDPDYKLFMLWITNGLKP